jgi:hypothetical protein
MYEPDESQLTNESQALGKTYYGYKSRKEAIARVELSISR